LLFKITKTRIIFSYSAAGCYTKNLFSECPQKSLPELVRGLQPTNPPARRLCDYVSHSLWPMWQIAHMWRKTERQSVIVWNWKWLRTQEDAQVFWQKRVKRTGHTKTQIAAFLRYAKCQKEKEIYNNMQKIKRNNKVQNTLVLIS